MTRLSPIGHQSPDQDKQTSDTASNLDCCHVLNSLRRTLKICVNCGDSLDAVSAVWCDATNELIRWWWSCFDKIWTKLLINSVLLFWHQFILILTILYLRLNWDICLQIDNEQYDFCKDYPNLVCISTNIILWMLMCRTMLKLENTSD